MKFLFGLALVLAIVPLCLADPQQFSYQGLTSAGLWGGISFNSTGCFQTSIPQNYTFFTFNIDSSNSSYYFVTGVLYHVDVEAFNVFIYSSFDPKNPCNGFYGNGQFLSHYTSDLQVFDGIFLQPGSYTVLVSSGAALLWSLSFSPSTTLLDITSDSNLFYAPYYDQNIGNSNNCASNSANSSFETYTWTQQTSGYFDIFGIAINDSIINPFTKNEYSIWLSLYSGSPQTISSSPCQDNFLAGGSSPKAIGGLDYLFLAQGTQYTIVASINSILGQVAIQVSPSSAFFISSGSNGKNFAIPSSVHQSACNPDTESSTDSDGTTPYHETAIISYSSLTIFATTRLFYQEYYSYFYPALYLYYGNNSHVPPETCYGIQDISSEFEIVHYITSVTPVTVSVIVGDPGDNGGPISHLSAGFHLFIFTGTNIGTPPNLLSPTTTTTTASATTTSSVASSTTSSSSSTTTTSSSHTATTTGIVQQTATTTTTSHASSTTTSSTGRQSATTTTSSSSSRSTTGEQVKSTTTGNNQNQGTTTTGNTQNRGTTTTGSSATTGGNKVEPTTTGHTTTGHVNTTGTTTAHQIKPTTGTTGNYTGSLDLFNAGSVTSVSMLTALVLSLLLLMI